MTDKEKASLLSLLMDIGDGNTVDAPDSIMGDTLSLIYGEWMNMESRNGYKKEFSHLQYTPEGVGTVTTSESERRVKYSIVEENRIEETSIDTEQAPTYGKEELNLMQGFLRQAVGVTQFKDSKERWYVQHCYNLMKKIGKEEFQHRLKEILSDPFKQKNSNKLAYLYGELKSYIHSPVVKPKQKESALDITL